MRNTRAALSAGGVAALRDALTPDRRASRLALSAAEGVLSWFTLTLLWAGWCLAVGTGCASCGGVANISEARSDGGAPPTAGDGGGFGDGGASAADAGTPGEPDAGGESCVATRVAADNVKRPMDVILLVDTSCSMGPALDAVRQSINTDFASILTSNGIDYRVILLADRGAFCVDPPLGGATCASTGGYTTPTPRLFQYSLALGSGNGLSAPLAAYATADSTGSFPGGWSSWLRADSYKVFLQLTDATSQSSMSAAQFDTGLLSQTPARFGSGPTDRRYTYHVIMGVLPNNPPTAPYLPSDPVVTGDCSSPSGLAGAAQETYQRAAMQSGGLRFSLCLPEHYDVVFQAIAAGVVRTASVPCELVKPVPPSGQTLDESTVVVKYTSGANTQRLLQVPNASACTSEGFLITRTSMVLCPQACALVQANSSAQLSVEYGCRVDIR